MQVNAMQHAPRDQHCYAKLRPWHYNYVMHANASLANFVVICCVPGKESQEGWALVAKTQKVPAMPSS